MKKVIYTVLSFSPILALAQSVGQTESSITGFAGSILRVFNSAVIPVLIGLAIIYFIWGLVGFVKSAGDAKAQEAGKGHMIWGLVALVVMVSIFGIINWLQSATGLGTGTVTLPQVPIR